MNKQPFLTFIVRCCQRPKMLSKALRSALAQTDRDFEIIFIVDKKRRGVPWANKQFALNSHRINSKYVYSLDDDTFLPSRKMVATIKRFAQRRCNPAVIMVKGRRPQLAPHILPKESVWRKRSKLKISSTNGACYVVRADFWKKHVRRYGAKAAADWAFLESLKNDKTADFAWLDFVAKETQQLGRGRKFEDCGKNWFEKIVQQFKLEQVSMGDWRMRVWLHPDRWLTRKKKAPRRKAKPRARPRKRASKRSKRSPSPPPPPVHSTPPFTRVPFVPREPPPHSLLSRRKKSADAR